MVKRKARVFLFKFRLFFCLLFISAAAYAFAGELCAFLPAEPGRHIEAVGDEAAIWGSLQGGFEAWVWPFKAFWDLKVQLSEKGTGRWISFAHIARSQIVRPWASSVIACTERYSLKITLFSAKGALESETVSYTHLTLPTKA